jgi:pilus assembly protein CpaB
MDRQKKFLILGVAWLSALAVVWILFNSMIAPKQEKQIEVAVATRDLPIGTLLRAQDLKLVNFPERVAPKGAVVKVSEAVSRVAMFPVTAGEPVLISKLSSTTTAEGVSSTIDPGLRAVSVPITDVTGVAGLIQSNSRVDVLFTRPGPIEEASTTTILQNIKVLNTGRQLQSGQAADPRAPRSPVVTLVMSPADAQKLELAKNQGKISLSLRNPLDGATVPNSGPVTTGALDPQLAERIARAKLARTPPRPVNEQKVFDQLQREAEAKKKEAEKPRAVVDVFRGDKHVQEVFK